MRESQAMETPTHGRHCLLEKMSRNDQGVIAIAATRYRITNVHPVQEYVGVTD